MTPSRRAGLCVLLSLARSSGDIVELADAPVTVTPGTYYKYTEKFSVITKDDCHIAPHDTYTSVAVGGNLYDAACEKVRRTRAQSCEDAESAWRSASLKTGRGRIGWCPDNTHRAKLYSLARSCWIS